ncbi:MAG: hypothetical protein J6C86_03600 [Bacteroidaceae bacterium]|nr:hypothetical protein [Bacteroidaceae bacterium]
MNNKVAIVTQSYKNDYKECKLLCESIDKFASEIDHFIFVNDEDLEMFAPLNYGKHKVYKKGEILPWYLVRLPWKIMGHHFHISFFTIPVREWIIQQICKLGVFEVIGDEYDAVFNIDSETVFMRPFNVDMWKKDGRYLMYRVKNMNEPSHDEYCRAAMKLLPLTQNYDDISYWNYMNTPVCFVRENTEKLLAEIKRRSITKNWKLALCNTYRFSEYYTYGIYTDRMLKMENHYLIDYHIFPQIDISECESIEDFKIKMTTLLHADNSVGLWLQKKDRKLLQSKYLNFEEIDKAIKEEWRRYGEI